jgi:hypothetical protein
MPRGPPSGPVSASWQDIVAAEAHDPSTGMRVVKLHPRLSVPGTQHTVTIEEPPADPAPGTQLPLT